MRLQTVLAAHSHAFQLQYLPESPAAKWQQPLMEHQAQPDLHSSTLQSACYPPSLCRNGRAPCQLLCAA